MNCFNCDVELKKDFGPESDYQFENALWVGFFGGYAMFVDDIDVISGYEKRTLDGAAHEAVLCHDCAHELCESVPWIAKLIKPELSHSHVQEFWEKHPYHVGWDSKQPKLFDDGDF